MFLENITLKLLLQIILLEHLTQLYFSVLKPWSVLHIKVY